MRKKCHISEWLDCNFDRLVFPPLSLTVQYSSSMTTLASNFTWLLSPYPSLPPICRMITVLS